MKKSVAGVFGAEFLQLPEEVLTTTMIHHQHFFPVVNEHGHLLPAFLAVVNTEPDDSRVIARNLERTLVARLRDARFFWDDDCRTTLEDRLPRLDTVLFHKRLGSYRARALRIDALAGWGRECTGLAAASAFLRLDAVARTDAPLRRNGPKGALDRDRSLLSKKDDTGRGRSNSSSRQSGSPFNLPER